MVSWFRLLDARWSDYEHQLRPNGNSAAIQAHEGFNAVKAYAIDEIETGFKDWWKNWKDCPGVMIAVRGKNNSNKGMLDAMHNLKLVKDKRDVTVVMGVDGLSSSTTLVGVKGRQPKKPLELWKGETGEGSKRSSMRSAAGASLISLRSDRSTLIAPVGQTNSIRRGAAPQREDRNYRRSMTGGSETPTILIVVALKRCLKRSPQGSLSFFKPTHPHR